MKFVLFLPILTLSQTYFQKYNELMDFGSNVLTVSSDTRDNPDFLTNGFDDHIEINKAICQLKGGVYGVNKCGTSSKYNHTIENGGTIIFKNSFYDNECKGFYNISGLKKINLYSNISLVGEICENNPSILYKKSGVEKNDLGYFKRDRDPIIYSYQTENIHLKDITLKGDNITYNDRYNNERTTNLFMCLNLKGVKNSIVYNVNSYNCDYGYHIAENENTYFFGDIEQPGTKIESLWKPVIIKRSFFVYFRDFSNIKMIEQVNRENSPALSITSDNGFNSNIHILNNTIKTVGTGINIANQKIEDYKPRIKITIKDNCIESREKAITIGNNHNADIGINNNIIKDTIYNSCSIKLNPDNNDIKITGISSNTMSKAFCTKERKVYLYF